jgi:hypothetical protein
MLGPLRGCLPVSAYIRMEHNVSGTRTGIGAGGESSFKF